MTANLLLQLEQKVEHIVEFVELMRLQIEELEEENHALRAEQEKWKTDLSSLLSRLNNLDEQTLSNTPQESVKAEKGVYEFAEP